MIPIELTLENFTCHVKSVIDFRSFQSAVVIGQGEEDTAVSNGVGKSKIFAAVNYVLFNQSPFDNIENIIRDGTDKCKVTYIFQLDDTYKIERTRSRKASGNDIRIYRKTDEEWTDLSERTSSQTEKVIAKIIKINFATFMNSVHFGQNDLSGLACLSPGDRKKLLKEALQLHVYSSLEKITKSRLSELTGNLNRSKAIMSTYEGLDLSAQQLEASIVTTTNELQVSEAEIAFEQSNHDSLTQQLLAIFDREKALKTEHDTINQKVTELSSIMKGLESSRKQSASLRDELKGEFQKKKADLLAAHEFLKELMSKEMPSVDALTKENDALSREILEKSTIVRSNVLKIKESSIELPGGPQCDACLQSIPEEHRESCQEKAAAKIAELQKQDKQLLSELDVLKDRQKTLTQQARLADQQIREVNLQKRDVETKEKELESIKTKYQSFDRRFKESEEAMKLREVELQEWVASQELFTKEKSTEFTEMTQKVAVLQNDLTKVTFALKVKKDALTKQQIALGIQNDRLTQNVLDKAKRDELAKTLLTLEDDVNLHQLVAQAYGTKGIPALIIHNMLDDLQCSANEIISQIRPGLQLEFEIDKENSKGEQTDTLNIKYSRNGKEREYEQLSGAQKFVVTLGLRLGLSQVIQKNLGVDIKFLMLDEVDASLDDRSLDAFVDMIKVLEKNFKILVITHNKELKPKFNNAIFVEQDSELNSTAKLISW